MMLLLSHWPCHPKYCETCFEVADLLLIPTSLNVYYISLISMAECKKGLSTKILFQCIECGFINKNFSHFIWS